MVQSSTDSPYFHWPEVDIPTLEDKTAEQGPDLESAASALRRLETMIADMNDGQIADLQSVPSWLEPLERLLEEQRAEFDALDFIGKSRWGEGQSLWGSEEFHSNVLAWLLDPRESHGYGDRFLRRFLARVWGRPADGVGDWSGAEVTAGMAKPGGWRVGIPGHPDSEQGGAGVVRHREQGVFQRAQRAINPLPEGFGERIILSFSQAATCS